MQIVNAQSCDRYGCGRIECGTPARPAPSSLSAGLQAIDPDPLPKIRDATAFDEFKQHHSTVNWFKSLDIENGYLFAGIAHGLQVWDVRNGGVPSLIGQIRHSSWPVWVNDPHTFWPLHDVDSPAGVDSMAAIVGLSGTGVAIFDLNDKTQPRLAYQGHGLDATQVHTATINGRHFAFVAAFQGPGWGGGGLLVYDMDAALKFNKCHEGSPDIATLGSCSGAYLGKIGSRPQVHYVDGIDNFVVFSSGTGGGFEIWDYSNPSSPQQKLAALVNASVYGVTLWKQANSYYLGLTTNRYEPSLGPVYELKIYDASCITGTCSSGLAAPLSTTPVSGGTTEQRLAFSRSDDGRPFIYASTNDACNDGYPQREFLFDVSNPTSPREVGGAAYWDWYYRGSSTGFNKVAPLEGKFYKDYFYRAAYTIFDVHKLVVPSAAQPPATVELKLEKALLEMPGWGSMPDNALDPVALAEAYWLKDGYFAVTAGICHQYAEKHGVWIFREDGTLIGERHTCIDSIQDGDNPNDLALWSHAWTAGYQFSEVDGNSFVLGGQGSWPYPVKLYDINTNIQLISKQWALDLDGETSNPPSLYTRDEAPHISAHAYANGKLISYEDNFNSNNRELVFYSLPDFNVLARKPNLQNPITPIVGIGEYMIGSVYVGAGKTNLYKVQNNDLVFVRTLFEGRTLNGYNKDPINPNRIAIKEINKTVHVYNLAASGLEEVATYEGVVALYGDYMANAVCGGIGDNGVSNNCRIEIYKDGQKVAEQQIPQQKIGDETYPGEPVRSMAFSDDGKLAAVSFYGAYLYKLESGAQAPDNQNLSVIMPSSVAGSLEVTVKHGKAASYYCDISIDDEPVTGIFTLAQNQEKTFTINNVALGQHILDAVCSTDAIGTDMMSASKQFESTTNASQQLIISMPSAVPASFNASVKHLKNKQYYCDLSINDQPVTPIFTLNPDEQKTFTISNAGAGQKTLDAVCSVDAAGTDVLVASKTFTVTASGNGSGNMSSEFSESYVTEYCCIGANYCQGFGSQQEAAANCAGTASQYSCSQQQNRNSCESCCEINGIKHKVFDKNDCDGIFYAGQKCQT